MGSAISRSLLHVLLPDTCLQDNGNRFQSIAALVKLKMLGIGSMLSGMQWTFRTARFVQPTRVEPFSRVLQIIPNLLKDYRLVLRDDLEDPDFNIKKNPLLHAPCPLYLTLPITKDMKAEDHSSLLDKRYVTLCDA